LGRDVIYAQMIDVLIERKSRQGLRDNLPVRPFVCDLVILGLNNGLPVKYPQTCASALLTSTLFYPPYNLYAVTRCPALSVLKHVW
jgi:hypothetical protein